jgi:hypothetical protein
MNTESSYQYLRRNTTRSMDIGGRKNSVVDYTNIMNIQQKRVTVGHRSR